MEFKPDGLMHALSQLAGETSQRHRITCRFDCTAAILVEDNIVATQLYRIVQEAVNNAMKHGKARGIVVSLSNSNGHVRLSIADDGAGLPDDLNARQGLGLHTMRYRAGVIGGKLDIRGREGGGAVVECILPLPQRKAPILD